MRIVLSKCQMLVFCLILSLNSFAQNKYDKTYETIITHSERNNGAEVKVKFRTKYGAFWNEPTRTHTAKVISYGNTVYVDGKAYTRQQLGEELYASLKLHVIDIDYDVYDGSLKVSTVRARNVVELDVTGSPDWDELWPGVSEQRAKDLFEKGYQLRNARLVNPKFDVYSIRNKLNADREQALQREQELQRKRTYQREQAFQAQENKQKAAELIQESTIKGSVEGNWDEAINLLNQAKQLDPNNSQIDELLVMHRRNKEILGSNTNSYSLSTPSTSSYLSNNYSTSETAEDLLVDFVGGIVLGLLEGPSEEELRLQREEEARKKAVFANKLDKLSKRVLNKDCSGIEPLLKLYTPQNAREYDFDFDPKYKDAIINVGLNNCQDKVLQAKLYAEKGWEAKDLKTKIDWHFKAVNTTKSAQITSFKGFRVDPMYRLKMLSLQDDFEQFKQKYDGNLLKIDPTDNILTKRYEEYSGFSQAQLQDMYKLSYKKYKRRKRLPWVVFGVTAATGLAAYFIGESTWGEHEYYDPSFGSYTYEDYSPIGENLIVGGGVLMIAAIPAALISIPLKKKKQRYYLNQRNYVKRHLN